MTFKPTITIWVMIFVFSACILKPDANDDYGTVTNTTSVAEELERGGIPVDFNAPVLNTVYVTNRTGAMAKQLPNASSETITSYSYGDKLEVVEENKDWLGIRDRVTRKFKRNGQQIEHTGWEKLYIKTTDVGTMDEIALIPEDLNVTIDYKGSKEIIGRAPKWLSIQLIDRSEYERKKPTRVEYLVADTNVILKKNGVLSLPLAEGVKYYRDKPNTEEGTDIYSYIGNIPFLNKYVISGEYWEWSDYKLIDKSSGKEEVIMESYPHVSNDRSKIISVAANGYDANAHLELFSISGSDIKLILDINLKNWMPTDGDMFWANDGAFYIPVLSAKAFWKSDGNFNNENFQYIRVQIFK